MKTYKTIINSFINDNDIRCIPDTRGEVLFNLEDVIEALKINNNSLMNNITMVSYIINNKDMLFISRETMEFLILKTDIKYTREIFRNLGYTWFK